MTDEPTAAAPNADPDNDASDEKQPTADHVSPVSDGPGQHHPNADTTHTAVPNARFTHKF